MKAEMLASLERGYRDVGKHLHLVPYLILVSKINFFVIQGTKSKAIGTQS